jgi:hypothetical protein
VPYERLGCRAVLKAGEIARGRSDPQRLYRCGSEMYDRTSISGRVKTRLPAPAAP